MSLLYKSMKMLKVKDIYELEIAKFMHSYYHCKLSENFGNYFKNASNHHKYNTGSIVNDNYYVERANTRKEQQFCSYIGVKIWNKTNLYQPLNNKINYSLRKKNIKYVSFCV